MKQRFCEQILDAFLAVFYLVEGIASYESSSLLKLFCHDNIWKKFIDLT